MNTKLGYETVVLDDGMTKTVINMPKVKEVPTGVSNDAACKDCGKPYEDFPLDVTLPDDQWRLINGSPNGLLCAACIVERAASVPGVIIARLSLVFVEDYPA